METTCQHIIELRGISKRFGITNVLRDLDLSVARGEILALLGPSGCGKSTTLNIIAGFYPPDTGNVFIDGVAVDDVPTHKRNLGMVFQSYSLFPHKTVFDNVAFGLSLRRVHSKEIRDRVMGALSLVRLPELANRFPAQLSGGQQQRVAVARALVVNPKVLLLDEPLSNLDAQLRKEMQVELKRIQFDTGVTMIYVTHDQEEALTLADRIALMRGGIVEQLSTPTDIFENPKTHYTARFMGFTNFLPAELTAQQSGSYQARLQDGTVILGEQRHILTTGREVLVAIREERVIVQAVLSGEGIVTESVGLHSELLGENMMIGQMIKGIYAGSTYILSIECAGGIHLQARVPVDSFGVPPVPGMMLKLLLPKKDVRILGKEAND